MEEEIFGKLTQEQFTEFSKQFKKQFGDPVCRKRIKISYWDPSIDKNFDPQLRITNGQAQVMVKKGDWENREVRVMSEKQFDIVSTIENCMSTISALDLMYQTSFAPNAHQYEHYIWNPEGYEIKLAKQFNEKNTFYLFEIELIDMELSLNDIAKKHSLEKHILHTDLTFWEEWNKVVNIKFGELDKSVQEEIIEQYLD